MTAGDTGHRKGAPPPPPHDLFRALGDPTRLALYERLCQDGPLPVAALTAPSGVSQPAVSKHLAVLKRAGLVSASPQGRQTFYTADPAALGPVADWTARMTGFWQARLDRLADTLNRMDQ